MKFTMKQLRIVRLAAVLLALVLLFGGCGGSSSSDTIADGTYTPDDYSFTWSGGSGKVEITCDQVVVKKGEATATITFDSEYYPTLKVDDTEYDAKKGDGTSSFEIPVTLNEEMDIVGTTTRMSTPHDIEYTICITMGGEASESVAGSASGSSETAEVKKGQEVTFTAPEIEGLTFESTMDLTYADQFAVQYYSDDYKLLQVSDGSSYLLVPEGKEVPEGLSADITALQQPVDHIYLAATAVMSLFDSIDGLSNIRLSGTQAEDWYVENAVTAMNNGDIIYAGKYSEPDYELLTKESCDLAIESTMILHSPKIKEMIENLDIPVLVDYSSYESHPLGRTEWVKFYGALLNKEDEADTFFKTQTAVLDDLKDVEDTKKTVAFFYIDSEGSAVVRETTDYIPAMIKLAGGDYIFTDPIDPDSTASSVSMTMEEFYASCVDADYLIYNSAIEAQITSIDDLLSKSELFSDFKAVKDGNVYSCGKNLYQATDTVAQMIQDIHLMLTGADESQMTFLKKVK